MQNSILIASYLVCLSVERCHFWVFFFQGSRCIIDGAYIWTTVEAFVSLMHAHGDAKLCNNVCYQFGTGGMQPSSESPKTGNLMYTYIV